jgi:hypothetical protein
MEQMNNIVGTSGSGRPDDGRSEKVPRWKAFTPLRNNKVVNVLKSARPGLKTASKALSKASDALDTLTEVVQLLKLFESTFQNLLFSSLSTLIDYFQAMVDSAKSTGVYFIDLTSYHWIDGDSEADVIDPSYESAIKDNEWFTINKLPSWEDKKDAGTTDQRTKEEMESSPWTAATKAGAEALEIFKTQWKKQYLKETYGEFIERICEAFNDPQDEPSTEFAFRKAIAQVGDTEQLETQYQVSLPRLTQTGRPNFGPNAWMYTVLVAYAFPSLDDVLNLMQLLYDSMGLLLDDAMIEAWKKAKNIQVNFDPEIGYNAGPVAGSSGLRAKEPNFYGINANSVFLPIFNLIDGFIISSRILVDSSRISTSLFSALESAIEGIRIEIARIEDIVTMLQQLITMLDTISKATGVRILTFETEDGVAGVMEALKNATGFGDNKTEEDRAEEARADRANQANYIKERKAVKAAWDAALENKIRYTLRIAHLNIIDTAVTNWKTAVDNSNLENLRVQLADMQAAYGSGLASIEAEIAAIIATHEDWAGLTWKAAELTIQNNFDNDGRPVSAGDLDTSGMTAEELAELGSALSEMEGEMLVEGYNQRIAAKEAELIELDAWLDPASDVGEPEDYEETRARVILEIQSLQDEQIACNNKYVLDLADNQTNQNTIVPSGNLNTQLTNFRLALQDAKNHNNPLWNDPDMLPLPTNPSARKYSDRDAAEAIALANLELELTGLEDTRDQASARVNTAYTAIVDYDPTIVPDNYERWSELPSEWDPVLKALFNDIVTGYWAMQDAYDAADLAVNDKLDEITAGEAVREEHQAEWNTYSIANTREQRRLQQGIFVINTEITEKALYIERDRLLEQGSEELIAIAAIEAEIQTILNSAWNTYLSPIDIYRHDPLPYTNVDKIWSDWTGNEIGYMIAHDAYNYREPQFNELGFCGAVKDAMAQVSEALAVTESSIVSYESQYKELEKEENKRKENLAFEKLTEWNPDMKMCYGGALFTMGYPKINDDTRLDISKIYYESFKNPLVSNNKQLSTQFGKMTSAYTKKIMDWIK